MFLKGLVETRLAASLRTLKEGQLSLEWRFRRAMKPKTKLEI
jgi:hypothetical protein